MYTAYSRPLLVHYRSRVLSLQTTSFYLLYGLALRYLLPLAIVWWTDGFWLKEATFREVPAVAFKRQMYLRLEGVSSNSNSSSSENSPLNSKGDGTFYVNYGYSSWPVINDALRRQSRYLPVSVSDYEDDADQDSPHLDRLHLSLNIPLNLAQTRVHKIQLLLLFSYTLTQRVNVRSEMLGLFESSSSECWFPGRSLHLVGTLKLHQQRPFPYTGFDYRYNASLLGETGERLVLAEDSEDSENPEHKTLKNTGPLFTLEGLLDAYYTRDCKS